MRWWWGIVPAQYDTALVRFVLKQLEKTDRVEQVGSRPNGAEWCLPVLK